MTKEEAKDYIREWCPYDRQEEIIKALEQEPCEDVIDRAEAMTEIMMFAGNVESDEEDGYIKVSDAVQLLRELPPITPQPRWIPISERLPEDSLNSVIGWDTYRERCVFVQYIDGYFQITGSDESFNIVAWMPLPEPYKVESEDKE